MADKPNKKTRQDASPPPLLENLVGLCYNAPMKTGIYKITNKKNGKFYVGSAVYFYERWSRHKSLLKRNLHPNIHLQRAWNKQDPDDFVFEVIERCEREVLLEREQFWLDELKPFGKRGYNIAKNALHPMLGRTHTKEWRENHSRIMSGEKHPMFGKRLSEKSIEQGRQTQIKNGKNKGENNPMFGVRKFKEENHFYGKKHKQETIDKIKASMPKMNGEKNPFAKLTWEIVREIRKLRKEDPKVWTLKALQNKFQVCERTILDITKNRSWIELVIRQIKRIEINVRLLPSS